MHVRLAASALALAALLAPASAAAQQEGGPAPRGPSRWALLLGVEDGEGPAGLQLRADLEFPQRPLAPGVAFSVVGSLGYSRFHDEQTELFTGNQYEASSSVLRGSAAARLAFGRHPAFRPYVDAGLGLYYGSWNLEVRELVLGTWYTSRVDDSEVGLFMRLAAGATFQVNPSLALGAELGFTPYLGDQANETTTSALVSATFRL